jgi:hypothetical protein
MRRQDALLGEEDVDSILLSAGYDVDDEEDDNNIPRHDNSDNDSNSADEDDEGLAANMSSLYDMLQQEDGAYDPGNDSFLPAIDMENIIRDKDVNGPTRVLPTIKLTRFEALKELGETFINKALQNTDIPTRTDDVFLHFANMKVEEVDCFDALIATGTVSPLLRVSSATSTASASSATVDNPDDLHSQLRSKLLAKSSLHDKGSTVSIVVDNDKPAVNIPIFPSIREVTTALQLTEDQLCAFYIMGKKYLESLSSADETSDDSSPFQHSCNNDDDDDEIMPHITNDDICGLLTPLGIGPKQAVLKLQGKAGTGKSHIMRGLLALEKGWLRERTIMNVTITGIAAVNVKGVTIDSLLCQKNSAFYNKVNRLSLIKTHNTLIIITSLLLI